MMKKIFLLMMALACAGNVAAHSLTDNLEGEVVSPRARAIENRVTEFNDFYQAAKVTIPILQEIEHVDALAIFTRAHLEGNIDISDAGIMAQWVKLNAQSIIQSDAYHNMDEHAFGVVEALAPVCSYYMGLPQ